MNEGMGMDLRSILFWVPLLWGASELALALTRRSKPSDFRSDRSSTAILWIVIVFSVTAGVLTGLGTFGHLHRTAGAASAAGLALVLAGIALRWTAILTLKKAFTVDVAVAEGQRLIRTGIYRRVRHPAYAGSLMSFLGLGLCLSNWASLLVIMVPVSAAFLYRIRVEEEALSRAFGAEYSEYMSSSKRLIPGLY